MKFFMTIALVAISIAVINAGTIPDNLKEKVAEIKKECKGEVPEIEDGDLEKLKQHEFVDNAAVKKFIFCFNKKAHVQHDDGSFDMDALKDKVALFTGSHDHDAEVEECAKDLHHDGPENAYAFATCIKPKLHKD